MKNIKKIIHYIIRFSVEGTSIGLVVSIFLNYSSKSLAYYPSNPSFTTKFATPLDAMTVSVILWALMGLLFGFGSLVFSIKKRSLLKKTIINFLIYYTGFILFAFLADWFPLKIISLSIFTGLFILVYVSEWYIRYNKIRKEIRDINNKIKKK